MAGARGPFSIGSFMEEEDRTGQNDTTGEQEKPLDVDQLSDSSEGNRIFLSVCLAQGRLGAAYYDSGAESVSLLQDISEEVNDLRLLRSLLRQVQPNWVLANSKQDDRLLNELKTICQWDRTEMVQESLDEEGDSQGSEQEQDDDPSSSVYVPLLHLMPNAAFNYSEAKHRLEQLLGDSEKNDNENRLSVAFQIDLDNTSTIRALGALLKYMDVKRIGVELEDYSVKTPITKMQTFTVEQMVEMDGNTLTALQIFQLEFHPSVYKAGRAGSYKEGLSLLGICNRCKSAPGRAELRRWFERPLVNREILCKRQDAVSFFLQDCNQDLSCSIQRALRNVKNIAGILKRIKGSQASVGDWQSLYKTVYYLMFIGNTLKSREVRVALIKEMYDNFDEHLSQTAVLLDQLIDFEQMAEENRFVVQTGIDPELDELKKKYLELPQVLTNVARKEFERYNQWISECSVIYLPMLGYLLSVPKQPHWTCPSDYEQIPGLEFVFHSDQTVHYKTDTMYKLDTELGDLKFQIIDAETSMMLRLQEIIIERTPFLLRAVSYAAQIDCLVALSVAASEHEWVRPELVSEAVLDVERARHPLVEMCSNTFVPNPIKSGGQHAKLKILTGPNASGKSIYLKQVVTFYVVCTYILNVLFSVGLVVYLAHIGSFVPASKARIGPVDRIFTRVHTLDSVLDGLSTFARDLQQMAVALRRASNNSLVIVDEFGKGTMTEVGLSLLTASLEHWLSKGPEGCPHLIVSSHLHALLSLLPDSPLLTCQTMEVMRTGTELTFMYKLVDGTIDCSYAAYTALQAGLPEEVVERGYEIYNCLKASHPISPINQEEEHGKEDQKIMKEITEKFLEWDLQNDCESFLDLAQQMVPRRLIKIGEPVTPTPNLQARSAEQNEEENLAADAPSGNESNDDEMDDEEEDESD